MSAEARLKEKNITLPKPSSPMANYVGAVRTGNLLFVSGHGPVRDGKATSQGKVGKDLTILTIGATLYRALEAAKRKMIVPVLVGPEKKIRAVGSTENVDLTPYEIVSTEHSHVAAQKAVELARAGDVDALMKGSLHTDELMGAVVPAVM